MSLLKADTIKPVTSSGDLSLQGDSGGSAVDCLNITSAGDINFTGNTDAKIKLPSAGGVYESDGSTAILTESGGAVTLNNVALGAAVTGFPAGGLSDFSTWRLTSSFTDSVDPISSNLAEVTGTNYQRIGDAFDAPSSGVFTFPSLGKWLITFNVLFSGESSRYNHTYLMTTVDNGSNWVTGARGGGGWGTTSGAVYASCSCSFLFDVTVLATHKCSFKVLVAGGSATTTEGSSAESLTYINFMKLGGT